MDIIALNIREYQHGLMIRCPLCYSDSLVDFNYDVPVTCHCGQRLTIRYEQNLLYPRHASTYMCRA